MSEEKTSSKAGLLEKFVPVLLLLTVVLAFMVGVLWQKVSTIEKGGTAGNPTTTDTGTGDISGKLTEDQAKKVPAVTDADHIRGSKDADIVIVEYSDLQCPFCQQFHPTMQQVLKEYGKKVAWVYRQFPLISIHPRANPAANAAECVAALAGNDAFWKFTDTVFSDQDTYLTDAGLKTAAVKAGANGDDFSICFKDSKYQSTVDAQQKGGEAAGITGTPGSFVINKKGEIWLVPGALPFDSLKSTIDTALAS